MPITRRTYSAIYYDGKARLQTYTPVNNFNPQGLSKGLLDVIASEMERLYNAGDYLSRAIDPTRNAGIDLENVGFLVGEQRVGSVTPGDFTQTNFKFYIDKKLNWTVTTLLDELYTSVERDVLIDAGYVTYNSSTGEYSLLIPAGMRVSNSDGSVTYTTTGVATLTGSQAAFVGVIATASGPTFNVQTNVLIEHRILEIPELRKLGRYIKCTNSFPIQNGSYSQSDDQLRYNISTKSSAFQGNELSVRRAVISLPGIRDILFEKNKFGSATVHIIIDSVSPLASEGLIAAAKQAAQNVATYGDIIFVSRPEYLGVELNFSVRVEPGTVDPLTIRNRVRDSIIQYINDLPIGGEIVWNKIISLALDTEGVVDFIPNYFKYGKYDIVNKINKEQVVLRFINQRARYNEKFYTDTGLINCCLA